METNTTKAAQQQRILAGLSTGATRTAACRAAHVARRTFYNWLEDPAFAEEVALAEHEAIEQAEGYVYQCAAKALEDPRYLRALFFLVKCKAGWNDRPPISRHASFAPDQIGGETPVGARHAVPSSAAPSLTTAPLRGLSQSDWGCRGPDCGCLPRHLLFIPS